MQKGNQEFRAQSQSKIGGQPPCDCVGGGISGCQVTAVNLCTLIIGLGVFFVCFFTQLLERVISSPSTLDCKVIAQVAWCEATCLQTIMV